MYRDSWKRFVLPEPPAVNYIVPWELLRILEDRGWHIHDQWGTFDNVPTGDNVTAGTDLDPTTLPLALQQAAATVWNIVASQ